MAIATSLKARPAMPYPAFPPNVCQSWPEALGQRYASPPSRAAPLPSRKLANEPHMPGPASQSGTLCPLRFALPSSEAVLLRCLVQSSELSASRQNHVRTSLAQDTRALHCNSYVQHCAHLLRPSLDKKGSTHQSTKLDLFLLLILPIRRAHQDGVLFPVSLSLSTFCVCHRRIAVTVFVRI